MPKIPDQGREARAHLLRRQFNLRLVAEGMSVQARRDRRAQADTAAAEAAEAAERRRHRRVRHLPGYVTGECREPFEPTTRLIRAADRPGDPENGSRANASTTRPTFEDMRAESMTFPAIPAEVHERQRIERKSRSGRRRK
ncbi:hypothetical protein MKK75_11070 [Methylobacterium sp. J-030]|uniref:hypothetical protein n=1 Tax=Methylobacterium sp. J-030 TaxID=2836627 RepID=UPI001FB86990|nr:hypothetical protein [Methylobacterium sp. J-030]MCJ2069335.1 hypothetical protein [Methylobacterium sp. J-030]